jgi:hypothetical protein
MLAKLWARQLRGLNPSMGKRFFCLQRCPDWLRGPPMTDFFTGIKQPGHDVDHSPSCSTKVKNE